MTENERQFLIELALLSKKHGLFVVGCGCCGSPYLELLTEEEMACPEAGYLPPGKDGMFIWSSPAHGRLWAENKTKVVR